MVPNSAGALGDSIAADGFFYYWGYGSSTGEALIYRTNGTSAGTQSIGQVGLTGGSTLPRAFTRVGTSTIYFIAPSRNRPVFQAFWRIDASTGGIAEVPIADGAGYTDIRSPVELNGKLFFIGSNSVYGAELCVVPSSTAGTSRVVDLAAGPASGVATLSVRRGGLYMAGLTPTTTTRVSVYRSDGTASGTVALTNSAADSSIPNQFVDTPAGVAFSLGLGSASKLWLTDGTASGTSATTIDGATSVYQGGSGASAFGILVSTAGTQQVVRRTDGTVAGTTTLPIVLPAASATYVATTATGAIVAARPASVSIGDMGLYRIDSTGPAIELVASQRGAAFTGLTLAADGKVYFTGSYQDISAALGRTDGTVAGTGLLFDPFGTSAIHALGALNNGIFVFASASTLYARPVDAPGMPRIAGRTYVDANGNGDYDTGEPDQGGVTLSPTPGRTFQPEGAFFFWVTPGTAVTISADVPTGRVLTEPAAGTSRTYTLGYGDSITDADFGYKPVFTIRGSVRLNGNYTSGGDVAYLDLDNDGALDPGEPSAVTNYPGSYQIDTDPGTYVLRIAPQAGRSVEFPFQQYADVSGNAGATAYAPEFQLIAGAANTYILPVSFDDLNRNGVRDAGEPAATADGIWADLNDDGVRDPGEPVPMLISGAGTALKLPTGGTYRIRSDYGAGFVNTIDVAATPLTFATSSRTTMFFGRALEETTVPGTGTIEGRVFYDANRNGIRDSAEQTFEPAKVFIDLDDDGARDPNEPIRGVDSLGRFRFANVAPGAYVVRQLARDTYAMFTAPAGFEPFRATVAAGQAAACDFGTVDVSSNEQSLFYDVLSFDDYNANGVRDGLEPGVGTDLNVFIDRDGDGRHTAGDWIVRRGTADAALETPVAPGRYVVTIDTAPGEWTHTTPRSLVVERGVWPPIRFGLLPPRIAASRQSFDVGTRVLTLAFDQSISANYQPSQFVVRDSLANLLTPASMTLAPDGRSLVIALPLNLFDGEGTVQIDGAALRRPDRATNPPGMTIGFRFLRGDANGDLRVNFDDLLILASNCNQTGRSYTQGNFDDDAGGNVNFDDLLILAARYNASLAPQTVPPPPFVNDGDEEPGDRPGGSVLA
jgi:ELWxxDGT repeat protein